VTVQDLAELDASLAKAVVVERAKAAEAAGGNDKVEG
jgi:hypothetical protein